MGAHEEDSTTSGLLEMKPSSQHAPNKRRFDKQSKFIQHDGYIRRTVVSLGSQTTADVAGVRPDFEVPAAARPNPYRPDDAVELSLGKKGRWHLLDNPAAQVANWNRSEKVRVSMAECKHRPDIPYHYLQMRTWPRLANCEAFHTVDETAEPDFGNRRPVISKRAKATFAVAQTLAEKPKPPHRRRRETAGQVEDIPHPTQESAHVMYEFNTPCKSTRLMEKARNYWVSDPGLPQKPRQTRRRVRDELSQWGSDLEESIVAEDQNGDQSDGIPAMDQSASGEISGQSRDLTASLADLAINASYQKALNKAAKKSRQARARASSGSEATSSNSLLDRWEFVDPPMFDESGDDEEEVDEIFMTRRMKKKKRRANRLQDQSSASQSATSGSFTMVPIQVAVMSHDLVPESLQRIYGMDYSECNCAPRRFSIDISDRCKAMLHTVYEVDPASVVVKVLCIFQLPQNYAAGQEIVICRMWLNAHLNDKIKNLELDTVNVNMEHNLPDLLTCAVNFVGILPSDYWLERQTPVLHGTLEYEATPFSRIYARSFSRITGTSTVLAEATASDSETEQDWECPGTSDMRDELTCGICTEELCGDDVNFRRQGFALGSCRHWFCVECLEEYVRCSIYGGRTPITCPEYGCKVEVEWNVLCTVAPLPDCQVYANLLRDIFMQRQEDNWLWCPNERCSRIVNLQGTNGGEIESARCVCGTTWCPRCREPAHWPVDCAHAKLYMEKVLANEDDRPYSQRTQRIRDVQVKQCPSCRTPMEKGFGCAHITCICGHAFCWGCMKNWTGYDEHDRCSVESTLGFETVELIDEGRERAIMSDQWYNRCVRHRHARLNVELRKLAKLYQLCSFKDESDDCKPVKASRAEVVSFQQSISQAHFMLEYVLVWLYYAKLDREIRKSICGFIDQSTFLIHRIQSALEMHDGDKMNRFMVQLQQRLKQLLCRALKSKKSLHDSE